jgi:glycosyltransferase involved in cell wall biosynthesis
MLYLLKGKNGRIVSQSASTISELSSFFQGELEYIPNPIVFEENQDSIGLEIVPNDFLLCIGRLLELKGFQDVIMAAKDLAINIVILGEGPFRKDLYDLSIGLGMGDRVFFYGWKQNITGYITKAKVCVVSSYVEGWPNVLNEMISCNGNVICSLFKKDVEDLSVRKFNPGDIDKLKILILDAMEKPLKVEDHQKYIDERKIDNYLKRLRFE